jgi:hypothetical protein
MSPENLALMSKVFGVIAAVMWLASAGLWAQAASIEIPYNQDTFMDEIRRAGRWNSRAAITACLAAVASMVVALCEVLR